MECSAVDRDGLDGDFDARQIETHWMGRSVRPIQRDGSIEGLYRVCLMDDTHGNDSYNPPSGSSGSDTRYDVDVYGRYDGKDDARVGIEGRYSKEFRDENGNPGPRFDASVRGEVDNRGDGRIEVRGGIHW